MADSPDDGAEQQRESSPAPVPPAAADWSDLPTRQAPEAPEATPVAPTLPQQADFHEPRPEVPGYEVLGELGRGGMGVVYKARQLRLNRIVAVKMILAGKHASRSERHRFLAEAQAAAALQHPNIVQIYGIEEHDGCPFFVLEYIDGPSLAKKYSGAPQSPRLAAQLVETLARAMHYAHEQGIVHRDLKPGNVLLTQEGVPKITDFGLAKKIAGTMATTRSGAILGTPGYMAPEQAEGKTHEVGPRADIYALGAILYELLGGRPPFQAATPVHTLLDLLRHEPPSLSRLQPLVPRDLQTICQKCLRKEPENRYATAEALANDLQRYLTDRPIAARPIGPLERLGRWCRRNPILAAMLGTIIVLVTLITVGSLTAAVWLHQARDRAVQNQERAERAEREAFDKLWDASLAHAEAGRRSGTVGRRFDSLASLALAAQIRPDVQLRNEAIACLALTDLRTLRQWPADGDTRWAFAHDCRRYAAVSSDGVRICAAASDEVQVQLAGSRDTLTALAFSPDDRWLLTRWQRPHEATARLVVWDVPNRTHRVVDRVDSQGPFDFSFDSRLLAVTTADGAIRVLRLETGQEVQRLTYPSRPRVLRFDPQARHLAVCRQDSPNVEVHLLESGVRIHTYPQPSNVTALAWSPDGGLLAAGCDDFQIYVWDTQEQRILRSLEGHRGTVTQVVFNHRGSLLMTVSQDLTGRLWDPWTGRELLQIPAEDVWFSNDDQRLAARRPSGRHLLYEVVTSSAYQCLHGHEHGGRGPWSVVFSPDGRWLASGSGDGIRLWDMARGEQVGTLPSRAPTTRYKGGPGDASQAVFLPWGQSVLVGGVDGLKRWPLRREPDQRTLRLGPPQQELRRGVLVMTLSGNGTTLALVEAGSAHVLVRSVDGKEQQELPAPPELQTVALSSDGRWLALGTARLVEVWDVAEAKRVQTLEGCRSPVVFSPDGRWLATSAPKRYHLWRTGTWAPGPDLGQHRAGIGGMLAFSPDSNLLAVAFSTTEVNLLDAQTGDRLARLEAPEPALLADLAFSPGSARLAVATQNHVVHLWDLRRLREQLEPMGLDWGLPLYRPAPDYSEPLRLVIEHGKDD